MHLYDTSSLDGYKESGSHRAVHFHFIHNTPRRSFRSHEK